MVETLYGVMHGKSITVCEVPVIGFETTPGKELINELLSLPPNTSVGIEHAPELEKTFEVDGVPKKTIGNLYWMEIKKICEQQHLNIVYLEDFPTFKKYVSKQMEKERLDEENLEKNAKFRKENPGKTTEEYEEDKEVRKISRKAYKAEVEAEYIFTIEREQKILDKIAEYQPQVVILGGKHSGYIALRPKELTSRKISLGRYKTEERPSVPWHEQSEECPSDISRLLQNPLLDKSELLYRELLKRRHRAVTRGRILSRGMPDYIGTWDLVIPSRGLFEIYVDKKDEIHGRIEDILGTAEFVGRIAENNAIFSKKYIPAKSSDEAAKDFMAYTADGTNGFYLGTFRVASGYANNKERPFGMRKFSESAKLNLS